MARLVYPLFVTHPLVLERQVTFPLLLPPLLIAKVQVTFAILLPHLPFFGPNLAPTLFYKIIEAHALKTRDISYKDLLLENFYTSFTSNFCYFSSLANPFCVASKNQIVQSQIITVFI